MASMHSAVSPLAYLWVWRTMQLIESIISVFFIAMFTLDLTLFVISCHISTSPQVVSFRLQRLLVNLALAVPYLFSDCYLKAANTATQEIISSPLPSLLSASTAFHRSKHKPESFRHPH